MDAQFRVRYLPKGHMWSVQLDFRRSNEVWNWNENYISEFNSLPPNLRVLIRRNHAHEDKPPNTCKSKQPKPRASLKLRNPPLQLTKHETFQKLSELFIKSLPSNPTTKHTISNTPDMRLVTHKEGPSLSHDSLEDLSSILRQDRRQVARKDTLTKKGRESLQMTHNQFCEALGSSPDPMLLTVWEHYRKSSKVHQYVNPWFKWVEYSEKAGSKPIPVNPFLFATWLVATSLSDTTVSPTETGSQLSLSLAKRTSQHHQQRTKLLKWHKSLLWEN